MKLIRFLITALVGAGVSLLGALLYLPYFLAQMVWAKLKIAAVVLSPRLAALER